MQKQLLIGQVKQAIGRGKEESVLERCVSMQRVSLSTGVMPSEERGGQVRV